MWFVSQLLPARISPYPSFCSILSLLIVDITVKEEYYTTFLCGIFTIVALQYLHYRSQPHDANLHAIRRDKDAGLWWTFTNGELVNRIDATLVTAPLSFFSCLQVFTLAP